MSDISKRTKLRKGKSQNYINIGRRVKFFLWMKKKRGEISTRNCVDTLLYPPSNLARLIRRRKSNQHLLSLPYIFPAERRYYCWRGGEIKTVYGRSTAANCPAPGGKNWFERGVCTRAPPPRKGVAGRLNERPLITGARLLNQHLLPWTPASQPSVPMPAATRIITPFHEL